MPIDPNIIVGGQVNPLDVLAKFQALKSQQLQARLGQQQLQSGQQEYQQRDIQMKSQEALNDAMRTAVTTGPDGNPVFDKQAITQHLAASGAGHLIPQVMENLQKVDETAATIKDKTANAEKANQEVASAKNDYQGMIGLSVKDAGYSPQAAIAGIAHGVAMKQIDPQAAQQLTAKIQANPTPEAIQALVDPLIAQSPKAQETINQRTTAQAHQSQADTQAARLQVDAPRIAAETKVAQQQATGTQPMSQYQQAELGQRQQQTALDAKKVGIEGMRAGIEKKKFDVTYGQGVNDNGQSIVGTIAQQVSNLQTPPPSPRSPMYGPVMQQVQQMRASQGKDPYQETDWQTKQAAAKDFSSAGKSGQAAVALNTLVRHTSDMEEAVKGLNNGSFTPGNALYQKIQQTLGSSAPVKFDQLKQYVVGETVKLVRGSGGSEGDVQAAKGPLDRSNSPDQLQKALETNYQVAGGKMQALNQAARRQNLGDSYNVLDPGAKQILQQKGYDTETMAKKATSGPGGGSAAAVQAPNGKTYHFKSQQDADNFKREAGIK